MTDREPDRMMQHVLLDAIKRDCEKETDDVPAFKPTRHYQRQMAAMLKDPLKWERRGTATVEECGAKDCRDPASVFAEFGEPDGSQPHSAGRSCALGYGVV